MIKKYYGKHVTKKIFLRKCHFAFILHFALATQGYIREKGIFQAGMILFTIITKRSIFDVAAVLDLSVGQVEGKEYNFYKTESSEYIVFK